MGLESSDMFRFDLGALLQGQKRIAKLKIAYNSLIIGSTMKPNCWKSLAGNLLMWPDLTLGHSFKVKQ